MRDMHDCLYHEIMWVLNMQFASFGAEFKYLVSIYSAFQLNLQINIKKTHTDIIWTRKKTSQRCTALGYAIREMSSP